MTDTHAPRGDERPPKPRPAPVPDADSGPYWSAAHEGRLVLQRCERCGAHQLYPRDRCLACRGPVTWVEASGRGTVYSFTVIRQNYARPFRDWIPYVVALVDLEEGPRLMTNIVRCAPEDVRIGLAVRATFEVVSEQAGIALFEPEDNASWSAPAPGPGTTVAVRAGLVTDTEPPRLLGSRCGSCGAHLFPRARTCPYCATAGGTVDVELSPRGRLWAWTAVTTAPPGYGGDVPYGFGVVELPEGVRVVTRLTEADPAHLAEGEEMETVLVDLHADDEGRRVVGFAFSPTAPR